MEDRAPVRVQLRRIKGWKMPAGTIVCSRPNKFSNPFAHRTYEALARVPAADLVTPWEYEDRVSGDGADHAMHWPNGDVTQHRIRYMTLEECVASHRRALIAPMQRTGGRLFHRKTRTIITISMVRDELAGRDLACWCALDKPCHVDTLLWVANAPLDEVRAAAEAEYELIKASAERVAALHPDRTTAAVPA